MSAPEFALALTRIRELRRIAERAKAGAPADVARFAEVMTPEHAASIFDALETLVRDNARLEGHLGGVKIMLRDLHARMGG